MKPKRYYVRAAIERWSSFEAVVMFGSNRLPDTVDGSCGVLLVFPTLEEFAKRNPGETPLVVEVVAAPSVLERNEQQIAAQVIQKEGE